MVSRKIALGTLNINDRGKSFVNDILNTNRLSYGKYTRTFEKKFAELHGCNNGIFCNSGTSALQIALAALAEVHNYAPGDEVLVPATTFIATSNIVLQNGLKPVFIDVEPDTFNIDWRDIYKHVTARTRCIIPVHLFGLPADMEKIMSLAKDFNLQVIEDSCETMFASQNGKRIGVFGDLACFSTYVAHLIVGGVGGLILTKNNKLAEICRSLMNHGRDSIYTNIDQDDASDDQLHRQIIERRYRYDRVGYSYRCTEFEAAIALSELDYWRDNIIKRRINAWILSKLLADVEELQLPYIPKDRTHAFMMYPMVLKEGNRDELLMYLEKRGIETRYLFPLLEQPIYKKLFPGEAEKYPVAQHLAKQGFFIGMHQGLTREDIEYVSKTIHDYFKEQKSIKLAFPEGAEL